MTWDSKFIDHLSKHSTLSEATINQHASRLRSFAAWMRENATIPAGNIERVRKYGLPAGADSAIVRAYFDDISNKHPADFRQHIKTALRHYYDYLVAVDGIKEVPDLEIPVRKNGKDKGKQVDVLTSKHVAALREHFKDPSNSEEYELSTVGLWARRDNLIFELMVQLGVRKGEISMLRFSDFHPEINQVTIRSTKTEGKSKYGGTRTMPLSPDLADKVKRWQLTTGLSDNGLLIGLSGHALWHIIKKAGIAVGLPWLKPHAFRHYCITKYCQLVGGDGYTPVFSDKEISMIFGVSPEVIAQRYDHPNPENIVSKALKSGVYSHE